MPFRSSLSDKAKHFTRSVGMLSVARRESGNMEWMDIGGRGNIFACKTGLWVVGRWLREECHWHCDATILMVAPANRTGPICFHAM